MAVTTATIKGGRIIKLTAANDVVTGPLRIQSIRVVGLSTAAHQCLIRTGAAGANDDIYDVTAATTNFSNEQVFSPEIVVNGIKVQTLSSGRVFVRVRDL